MHTKPFIVEIGTEELPPKSLLALRDAFSRHVSEALTEKQLAFDCIKAYAAPRRLALLIEGLQTEGEPQEVERRGPAVKAAFDAEGKPTKACEGFAKSCGVTVDQLDRLKTDKGEWLAYRHTEAGVKAVDILPGIIEQALAKLPIAKMMRWGDTDFEFVRPVKWILMLLGDEIVPGELFGLRHGNISYGHRFHHPDPITINRAEDYVSALKTAYVMADFDARREHIRVGVNALAEQDDATAVIDDALLNEVTAIVEWPVPLMVNFDKRFLQVPSEALIAAMSDHQKCFHVVDDQDQLLAKFITVSNIESSDPEAVIEGNRRVMRARLSDADFFFQQDCKMSLADHIESLKSVSYQAKLGSLYDKTHRITQIALYLAKALDVEAQDTERTAQLCKCDLMTDMVREFPELQGVMGYYYAKRSGENDAVASALRNYYHPRFSGDSLPAEALGTVLALAERLETLVGIFGINQQPTGMRDPFKLRRAALGIIRLIIEKQLRIPLKDVLTFSFQEFEPLENSQTIAQVTQFILDRVRGYYLDQGFSNDLINAVLARNSDDLTDFDQRLHALKAFQQLTSADALAAANKRVSKLLEKQAGDTDITINPDLLQDKAEQALSEMLIKKRELVEPLFANAEYEKALTELAELRQPVDTFFDEVMVMVDEPDLRQNRLALLANLRNLFLEVADISLLQTHS